MTNIKICSCCIVLGILLYINGCANFAKSDGNNSEIFPVPIERLCDKFKAKKWLDRTQEGRAVCSYFDRTLKTKRMRVSDIENLLGLLDFKDNKNMSYIICRTGDARMHVLEIKLSGDAISGITPAIITY